ncbi:MAG TPA: sigma-54 dependent transcriptional regulator [Bryobacteraceae bacterium]|nr:sigma-54 dependent transcriptional regulator [Bryobacteraceae bacterium]
MEVATSPQIPAWRETLVGSSSALERVADVVRLAAPRRSTVLITGETGTGKEVAARAIHAASSRRQRPIVAVNCGAIPANLIESELFGYVRGAFTGAAQSRTGRFEDAQGSTILLDEVGELPLDLQGKLLRVLQEREVQRLGSSEVIRLDIRVVAATNTDLAEAVRKREFREDLYYRLNVVPLRMPPLRERVTDIPELAAHFVRSICKLEAIPDKTLSASALDVLQRYSWPGNIRQLEHAVEMAVVLSGDRHLLTASDFPLPVSSETASAVRVDRQVTVPASGLNFDEEVSRFERSLLEQSLVASHGNKARAAELLQMKRTTLLAKLKALGMSGGADDAQSVCA